MAPRFWMFGFRKIRTRNLLSDKLFSLFSHAHFAKPLPCNFFYHIHLAVPSQILAANPVKILCPPFRKCLKRVLSRKFHVLTGLSPSNTSYISKFPTPFEPCSLGFHFYHTLFSFAYSKLCSSLFSCLLLFCGKFSTIGWLEDEINEIVCSSNHRLLRYGVFPD